MAKQKLVYPILGSCKQDQQDQQDINKLFNIRAHCWFRNYFRLTHAASILGELYVKTQIDESVKNILIQTKNGRIKWKDIEALILEPKDSGQYDVLVRISKRETLRVSNPTPNGEFDQMVVSQLRDVTVDYFIPINFVVDAVRKCNKALNDLIEAKEKAKDYFKEESHKKEIDAEELKNALEILFCRNDCILMTQSDNSKKRNNTNYIGYIRKGELDYDFIMAKDLEDGGNEYYVHYTSKDKKPKLIRGKAPVNGLYNCKE